MRTIESLKKNEVIVINSIEEYDEIALLLDNAGKRLCGGLEYTNKNIGITYPVYINVNDGTFGYYFAHNMYTYTNASDFIEKKLPKYWVVDISKDKKRGYETVIKYLNKVYLNKVSDRNWAVPTIWKFYGYDGNDDYNGTDAHSTIKSFENNPTELTIDEFITYPEVREVLGLNKETKTNKCKQMKYRLLNDDGYHTEYYKEGAIYNADYKGGGPLGGSTVSVAELANLYPEDWELVKVDTRFPFALTMGKAKEIMAVVCPEWQEKLGKLWGKNLLIYGYVEVDEALYKEGRKVATEKVNKLLDEIFGKDDQKITYEDVMDSFETIYYIEKSGNINSRGGYGLGSDGRNDPNNTYSANIHKRQQAQLKLANVAKHLNKDKIDQGFFIYLRDGKIGYGVCTSSIGEPVVYFKTRDLAEQAVEILGEKTVRLACQPLND